MKPLLMLHGWGFPSAVFATLAEQLTLDFAVEMPNRPGYGDSLNEFGDEQINFNEPVKLSSPSLVVGWSLGGQQALQLALRQPDMVTGLILLATTPCFVNRNDWQSGMDQAAFKAFQKQVKEDQSAAMQQFVRLNAAKKPARQTKEKLNDLSGQVSSSALLDGLDELESVDIRDVVKKISVPVLLLHALDDRVVPASASRWLHQQLESSQLLEYPTGGHAFFLQNNTVLADEIRGFQ